MIEKTIVFRADRKPNPSFVHIGFETDNMVERLVFVLPSIHVQQTATLMINGKYVNMAMLAEESGRYYIDLTAELVGAPGLIDAYITIDAPDGKVWNSAPFALVTGDLPDVDGAIQEHFPDAIQQMRQEIAGHRAEMQDQSKAVQEAADRAEKAAGDISDTLDGGTDGQFLGNVNGEPTWITLGDGSGGGSISKENDPTVPTWAKQPEKPTYTAEEVGAQPKGDYASREDVERLTEEIGNITGGNKTAFDAFMDNTDVDYAYDETTGAYYTVIRIYKDKLDGTKQYPFVLWPNDGQARTTYDLVMQEGYFLAINGGIFNNATTPDGMVIQNGVVMQNSATTLHPNCKPLTIDGDGNLGYAADDADANDLVAAGIVSAVSGFMPIVVDYAAVPDTEWNAVSHYTQNAQRQIIGQWGCGDYAIITCEGRSNHNSDGWTLAEAQQICIKHGLKFAYNLDGGGSTETMLGKKHINTIYENETGRRVPTFIVFNGTTSLDKVPVVPETPETYTTLEYVQFTKEQYIETNIAESSAFGVEAVISVDAVGNAGSHLVSAENSYIVTFVGGGKPTVKRCGSAEVSTSADTDKVVANTQYTIRAFVNDNSAQWNDTVITSNLEAGSTLKGNYIIGGYAGRPTSATYRMACKVYALKFYDNGVLTHDMVPSKSSSGAVGLLDTISNTFYQSATETPLVSGPAVS